MAISAGGLHNMAMRADGRLFVWGWGAAGQTNLPSDASDVIEISAGYYDCLAKTRAGQVIGWGRNLEGEISVPEEVNADYLPFGVSGYLDANAPGSYALTYTATNSVGGSDSVVRTIVIEDRTPPEFLNASNIVIDCTNEAGAQLGYLPTVHDQCSGDLSVTSAPPQGSILPIGLNQVGFTATDYSGNVARTNLQIMVLGPRRIVLDVMQQMSAEYAALPPNHAKWLKNAISQMNGLMVDNLWLSETNLSLLSGQKVFRRMEFVSQGLMIQGAWRKEWYFLKESLHGLGFNAWSTLLEYWLSSKSTRLIKPARQRHILISPRKNLAKVTWRKVGLVFIGHSENMGLPGRVQIKFDLRGEQK